MSYYLYDPYYVPEYVVPMYQQLCPNLFQTQCPSTEASTSCPPIASAPPITTPTCPSICSDQKSAMIMGASTTQSIPNNASIYPFTPVLVWGANSNVNQINTGNIAYDPCTGYFTVSKTGIYSISSYLTWDPNPLGTREMWIIRIPTGVSTPLTTTNTQVLATDTRLASTSTYVPTRVTLTTDAYLIIGDRIAVSVWQDSGSVLNISPSNQLGNKITIIQMTQC